MKGTYLSWRKCAWSMLMLTLLSITTFWSAIRMNDSEFVTGNLYNFYLTVGMAQGFPPNMKTIPVTLLCTLNYIIFQYVFGRIVDNDYFECSHYIFTRQKSRTVWYIKRVLCLLIVSLVYNTAYYFVAGFTIICAGVAIIAPLSTFVLIIEIILTSTLFIFLFSLITSVLSIAISRIFALYTTNILLVFSAILSPVYYSNGVLLLFKLNLIANIMPSWHKYPELSADGNPGLLFSGGVSHVFSITYFSILSIIVIAIGIIVVKRKDIV